MIAGLSTQPVTRNLPLRGYQEGAVEATLNSWKEWDRVLGVMATGGGKSAICGELAARNLESSGGRTLMLAHTRALVFQFAQSTENNFGIWSSVEAGGSSSEDSPVVCATVQTMINRLRKGEINPEHFSLIVWDESHHILSKTHLRIADYFPHAKHFGCTASPARGDQKDLMSFFQDKSFDIDLPYLIDNGYLSPLVIHNFPLEIVLKTEHNGDYDDDEIASSIEPYLEQCADALLEYGRDRASLVFLPLIATSKKFCAMLNERGLKSEHISGQIPQEEQRRIIRRFEMGKTRAITNSALLSEGIDIRCISLLMNLRPTKSWPDYVQKIGRSTRLFDPSVHGPYGTSWPFKHDSIILDPLWLCEDHSLLQRPSCLIASSPEQAKEIDHELSKTRGSPSQLMDAARDAKSGHEERLKQRLAEMADRSARVINPIEMFIALDKPELVEYEPVSPWESDPVTDAQRGALSRAGIDTSVVTCKGQAMLIMKSIQERWDKGLATFKMCNYAKALGHPDPYKSQFQEIRNFINTNK